MNFFEAQQAAKSRSRLLVALFAAALIGIILAVYGALRLILYAGGTEVAVIEPALFAVVATATAALVGGGSLFRTLQLRSGGSRVAEMLGGRRVAPDTTDPDERRLLNVVEEMAIASGTPVPEVFVLDGEEGINAFAAGYSIQDAAVAVTRGTLRHLDRNELQGVIAHEFSHILNGDMRLNVRLIGLLYGILLLTVIGRGLLRGSVYSSGSRRRKGSGGQVMLLGVALEMIGAIGVFFGRLIKAAVSRQREFLADAAAVQFTRNPDGLAGALRKIGGARGVGGSRIRDHHAEEASHLFFANGLGGVSFWRLWATHPPLEERIRRVLPSWDGTFLPIVEAPAELVAAGAGAAAATDDTLSAGTVGGMPHTLATAAANMAPLGTMPNLAASTAGATRAADPAMAARGARGAANEASGESGAWPGQLLAAIGSPGPAQIRYAARLLETLPDPLRAAARDPIGARALILALLISADEGVASKQREVLRGYADGELVRPVERLVPLVAEQPATARLPLLDLALPVLRAFSRENALALRRVIEELARADGRLQMFEFALIQVLERQLALGEHETAAGRQGRTVHSLVPIRAHVARLLSAVAYSGAANREAAERAFAAGAARLPSTPDPWQLVDPAEIGGFDALSHSLSEVGRGDLGARRLFLDACAHAIAADGTVRAEEAELFRALAEGLDIPVAPMVTA